MSKNCEIFENCVFQAYDVENIKIVASIRRTSNPDCTRNGFISKNIFKNICIFFNLIFEK